MNGIGAIPKTNPNKNIGIALIREINTGTEDENAIDAHKKPIPIPTNIVIGVEIPNVPTSTESFRKSTAEAKIPTIRGPNFFANANVTSKTIIMKRMLSIEYLTNPNKNLQKYSIQMFKAIVS